MPTPKKGVAYIRNLALVSTGTPGALQANPTIAAGDFRLSKDNGAYVNLTNLPVVIPAGGYTVQCSLTATEMTADRLVLLAIDQAGAEWGPFHDAFDTTVQTLDDVPTAVQNADGLLMRDWTAIVGQPPALSAWNALRFLRNAWAIVAGVLHVKREDGSTDAWTRTVITVPVADPVTGVT